MNSPQDDCLSGYSPDLSIDLFLAGEQFAIASIGEHEMRVRDARRAAPGKGTVRFTLDGKVTAYEVELPDGIDPDLRLQSYHVIKVTEGAAA